MSKIRIKNFGPIKEGYHENDGWLDIKKSTVFIGNQGSGKSTVAKLISTFSWMEKALTRGDYNIKYFTSYNRFRKNYCGYHRLENYFLSSRKKDITKIEYQGEAYSMKYENGYLNIWQNANNDYELPQIMYVPAERNFISTVKKPEVLKFSSESLVEFVTEFDNAKNDFKGTLMLPVNDASIEYDSLNDIVHVKGDGYKVRLTEASSGFQSLVPLYLVSRYLSNSVKRQSENNNNLMSSDELERFRKIVAEIFDNDNLTDEQKRAALSVLSSRFNKTSFINIVEEPEQNLFPNSQRQLLNSLSEFNNMNKGNKLIMTTHSPYIINYLTLAIKAFFVFQKAQSSSKQDEIHNKLKDIVPLDSVINSEELVIYELDNEGNIIKLTDYKGLPSDENYLNQKLEESNELFTKLLDIEDQCQ